MQHFIQFLALLALLQVGTAEEPSSNAVDVAKRLSQESYKGWSYGSDARKRQIDCVQFVLAVSEEVHGERLPETSRKRILIANLSAAEAQQKQLADLIESEDDRTKGIQHALVELGHGVAVQPADARPGDFIQYWMKRKDGTWFGHAGIIESVETQPGVRRARIFGAHASQNAIATSRFSLRLMGARRKIYIVRYR